MPQNKNNGTTTLAPPLCRDLQVSDLEILDAIYPHLAQRPDWWLEFQFLEDRGEGDRRPPLDVLVSRRPSEIGPVLKAHREYAAECARYLQQSRDGHYPAGLFWGIQPTQEKNGPAGRVAAFVAFTAHLDPSAWSELPQVERARAAWQWLHSKAPPPSFVTWTGYSFQACWLLQDPLPDRQPAEETQETIDRCMRGSHRQSCARLLRWPRSVNYQEAHRNQGRTVRIVWWHPQVRYAFSSLRQHFQPYANVPPPEMRSTLGRFYECFDQDSQLEAIWYKPSNPLVSTAPDEADLALAHAMLRHGFDVDAFAVVAPRASWNAQKTLLLPYLRRTWGKASSQQGSTVSPDAHHSSGPGTGSSALGHDEAATTSGSTGHCAIIHQEPEVRFPNGAISHSPIPERTSEPDEVLSDIFLSTLPESAWTEWARLYRAAVGPSTEAADEFHYISLLTVLGSAIGRTISISCGRMVYPNIYALLLGPTGDRKSTAANMALDLLPLVAPEVLLLNGVGSQEGLMERMADCEGDPVLHTRTLLFADEMASLLKKARRESSGGLIEFITEMFHCPDFKTHATRSKALYLKKPTMSILGASTPAWLEAALQEEDILGGFANRFIYVAGAAKPDNPLPVPPDQARLQILIDWMRKVTLGPVRQMEWTSGASKLWSEFYRHLRYTLTITTEPVTSLLRRIDLYILKFASINAAMDDTDQISTHHLTAAIDLGRFLAGCAHRTLADLGAPRDCRLERLIELKLQQAPQGTIRRKALRQTLGGRVTGQKLDSILGAMERNGIICQYNDKGQARYVRLTPPD